MKTKQSENNQAQLQKAKLHKKRVHWLKDDEQELEAHEVIKSRKKLKIKTLGEREKFEFDKMRFSKFASKRDYDGLLEYCKNHANKSKKLLKLKDRYGCDNREFRYAEKKAISRSLSEFSYLLFRKACVKTDLNFMRFLADHLTDEDFKRSILYDNYKTFDVYLNKNRVLLEPNQRQNFIEGLKLFFKIIDTTSGAFEHYIEQAAGRHNASNENREDFVTALMQAKDQGIISKIDLCKIQVIQDSYEDKEDVTSFSFVKRIKEERNLKSNKSNAELLSQTLQENYVLAL